MSKFQNQKVKRTQYASPHFFFSTFSPMFLKPRCACPSQLFFPFGHPPLQILFSPTFFPTRQLFFPRSGFRIPRFQLPRFQIPRFQIPDSGIPGSRARAGPPPYRPLFKCGYVLLPGRSLGGQAPGFSTSFASEWPKT